MSSNQWAKLENRHAANVQNRRNSNENSSLLYQYLMNTPNNSGSSNKWGTSEDWQNGANGFSKLAKGLLGNNTSSTSSLGGSLGSSAIGTAANNYIGGSSVSSGSAITDAINGVGGSGSAIKDAIGSTGSASGASSASSAGSSVPWALIGKVAKTGYNKISGHDDKEYSDVEESVIYPLQGASIGSMFGPWGALGGALYGLGYSFKDDLGMKDSNFLTQITYPIGMGDGGGLRVGGKSILDIG